jgi:hypothetical protein
MMMMSALFASSLKQQSTIYESDCGQTSLVSYSLVLVRTCFANYKKGCTRLAAASDKVYQLLAHGQLFSPGTPVSSTTKTGRHIFTFIGFVEMKSSKAHLYYDKLKISFVLLEISHMFIWWF